MLLALLKLLALNLVNIFAQLDLSGILALVQSLQLLQGLATLLVIVRLLIVVVRLVVYALVAVQPGYVLYHLQQG